MFTHLHTHSSLSPAWGIHTPEALCAAARERGMTRLALTDRNGFYGIPRFLEAAREAGIAPIIGAEVVTGRHRAVLLARDAEGYAGLCRLLSDRHCRDDFDLAAELPRHRHILADTSAKPRVAAPTAAGRRGAPTSCCRPVSVPGRHAGQSGTFFQNVSVSSVFNIRFSCLNNAIYLPTVAAGFPGPNSRSSIPRLWSRPTASLLFWRRNSRIFG